MAVLFRGRTAVTVPDEVAADYLADGLTPTPSPSEAPTAAEQAQPEGESTPEPDRAPRGHRRAAQ